MYASGNNHRFDRDLVIKKVVRITCVQLGIAHHSRRPDQRVRKMYRNPSLPLFSHRSGRQIGHIIIHHHRTQAIKKPASRSFLSLSHPEQNLGSTHSADQNLPSAGKCLYMFDYPLITAEMPYQNIRIEQKRTTHAPSFE